MRRVWTSCGTRRVAGAANIYQFPRGSLAYLAPDAPDFQEAGELKGDDLDKALRVLDGDVPVRACPAESAADIAPRFPLRSGSLCRHSLGCDAGVNFDLWED